MNVVKWFELTNCVWLHGAAVVVITVEFNFPP